MLVRGAELVCTRIRPARWPLRSRASAVPVMPGSCVRASSCHPSPGSGTPLPSMTNGAGATGGAAACGRAGGAASTGPTGIGAARCCRSKAVSLAKYSAVCVRPWATATSMPVYRLPVMAEAMVAEARPDATV